MNSSQGRLSPSGVWIASDFRDNLIIDRDDPVFANMRAGKTDQLRSENSEDAVTWNVFRSLRQIAPETWLPPLWKRAFPTIPLPEDLRATITLWKSLKPPPGLLSGGAEGNSEIDVIIETPAWVWFFEAKLRSSISVKTKKRDDRDQVLRNLDVGTHYAGSRPFYFSLLIVSDSSCPEGIQRIEDYADLRVPREKLRDHRPDGLANLMQVGRLLWSDLAIVFEEAAKTATRDDERNIAKRAFEWLQTSKAIPTPK